MLGDDIDYSRMAELHINRQDETVGMYAIAFLNAASSIFEHGICDFAPYPGMYCLRHGLELFVKQMTVYEAYEMRNKALLYRIGHGFLETWEQVKPYIEDCTRGGSYAPPDGPGLDTIARIDHTIREIHGADPSGMLYRYPEHFVKGKRVDTHFPEDRFYLPKWMRLADSLRSDCQQIEGLLKERCNSIQHTQKEYGTSLYDLVIALPARDESS